MPLVLNDEQSMLRDSAKSFISAEAPIAYLRSTRDSRDGTGFSRALWKKFAEMGFAGILIPEEFGGVGLGHVEAGVVAEELGRTLAPTPFLSTAILAASALARGGNEAQKGAYLPGIASGDLIATLAAEEGPKHRPAKVALAAKRSGNGFTLSGTKTFVLDGHVADLLIVAARTSGEPGDEQGITLFLVDAKAKGIATERTVMVDAHNAARVAFDQVEVTADQVLGEVDGGYALLEATLDVGRAVVAAELVGVGEEAFAKTLTYIKERKQFDKLIGEFQALQHRSAHLFSELEVTKAAVIKALQVLDEDAGKAPLIVSVAKARAGASAELAVQEAVQMHGGYGMTDEYDVGLFMKRARVAQELFGDSNFHADRLARRNAY